MARQSAVEEYSPHVQRAIEKAERRRPTPRLGRLDCTHGWPIGNGCPVCEAQPISHATVVAKGRVSKPQGMNKLEASYDAHLLSRKVAGEILWHRYEGITLKLGYDCRLTVDFFLMTSDLELEAHETKGWWKDDARVKIRTAASMFPFRFVGVQKDGDGWKFEEFKP